MSIMNINTLQEQAVRNFENLPQSEAAQWAQIVAQCEIALQLQGIKERLHPTPADLERRIDDLENRIDVIWSAINALQEYHN